MHSTTHPNILAQFLKANRELDRIQKHLEEYLETKLGTPIERRHGFDTVPPLLCR
jgi:hypothetical protein